MNRKHLWRSHSVPFTQRTSPEVRVFKPFVKRDGFSALEQIVRHFIGHPSSAFNKACTYKA
jgi:hypothetical protein